jgi:hypothetical protein
MARVLTFGGPTKATAASLLGAIAIAAGAATLPCRAAAAERQSCAATVQDRGLDFWLGRWNVSDDERPSHASSVVSLELGKCLIVEHWTDPAGHRGENLFGYNRDANTWSGMFADNRGRIHIFVHGTVAAGKAELDGQSRGPHGEATLDRVTIVRMTSNDVEQRWQQSADGGTTWTTVFQGKYSRAKP